MLLVKKNSIVAGYGRVATGFGDQRVTRSQCSTESIVFSFNDDVTGVVTAGADSIIEDGTCNTTALSVDPMLGLLAPNGGTTYTHAILAGSPAINIGKLSFCQAPALNGRDQRSFIYRGLCDAGSYEFRDSSSIGADGFFIGPLFLLLEEDD